jgi:hypothetical protein
VLTLGQLTEEAQKPVADKMGVTECGPRPQTCVLGQTKPAELKYVEAGSYEECEIEVSGQPANTAIAQQEGFQRGLGESC